MLKELLQSGHSVLGTTCRIVKNPAVTYIAKNSGLDFILYDAEHAGYDMETLHDLFLMGRTVGISSLVRVPTLGREWVSRVLDQGADGVILPMVESREQAETLVRWAYYPPIGNRGFGTAIAHCDYMGGKTAEIIKKSNYHTLVAVQIETELGIEHAEEIAAVEGVDVLLIGVANLACSYGCPGNPMNEKILNGIRRVAKACRANKKVLALPGPLKLVEQFKHDTRMVLLYTDTNMLIGGMRKILTDCKEIGLR